MQRAPEAPENGPPETLQEEVRRALSARDGVLSRRAGSERKMRSAPASSPAASPKARGRPDKRRAARGFRRWEDWQPMRSVAWPAGVSWGRWACGTRHRPTPNRCGFADSSGSGMDGMPPGMVRRPFAGRRDRRHGSGQGPGAYRPGKCQAEASAGRRHRPSRQAGHILPASASTGSSSARRSAVTHRDRAPSGHRCQRHRGTS